MVWEGWIRKTLHLRLNREVVSRALKTGGSCSLSSGLFPTKTIHISYLPRRALADVELASRLLLVTFDLLERFGDQFSLKCFDC